MAVMKKVLLDWLEYERLLNIEKNYNELLKKQDMSGSGISLAHTVDEKERQDAVETKVSRLLPPITTPSSETVSGSELKATSKGRAWYFLGKPT
jgi:hypothetical protein